MKQGGARVYTVEEIARYFQLHVRVLNAWAAKGYAPASVRTEGGGQSRYSERDRERVSVVQALRRCGVRGDKLKQQVVAVMGNWPRDEDSEKRATAGERSASELKSERCPGRAFRFDPLADPTGPRS